MKRRGNLRTFIVLITLVLSVQALNTDVTSQVECRKGCIDFDNWYFSYANRLGGKCCSKD